LLSLKLVTLSLESKEVSGLREKLPR
jgi:hypothetical protein